MDEEGRKRTIIKFIREHPTCKTEKVVEGVENEISRVTVFKILHKLLETGEVQRYSENKQKRNNREHKLIVNEGNPLVSVRVELENFESAYFHLLHKTSSEFQPKLRRAKSDAKDPTIEDKLSKYTTLRIELWDIFYSMVDAYLFRFLFIWSNKISDSKMLQQLYSMVFSKITEMQIRLSEPLMLQRGKDIDWRVERFLETRLNGPIGSHLLGEYLDSFKESGMEQEIEPVIDSLWKIQGELQPYAYAEPRNEGWSFKYGEDDWRKLVRLSKQHPIF